MTIIVPPAGGFAQFEAKLNAALLDSIVNELTTRPVDLSLPKFEFETSVPVTKALQSLGINDAFSPGVADFSGIDGSKALYISDVRHKAFIKLDEEGTEAAAATAVTVGFVSAPPRPIEMVIDRPFIFLIRDHPTGAILFVGRVLDPTK